MITILLATILDNDRKMFLKSDRKIYDMLRDRLLPIDLGTSRRNTFGSKFVTSNSAGILLRMCHFFYDITLLLLSATSVLHTMVEIVLVR